MNKGKVKVLVDALEEFKNKINKERIDVSVFSSDNYNGATFIISDETDDSVSGSVTIRDVDGIGDLASQLRVNFND